MKKKLLKGLVISLMGIGLTFGAGCDALFGDLMGDSSDTSTIETPETNYQIVVSGDSVLEAMEEGNLRAVVFKDGEETNEKVEFVSKDESLLKIDANGHMVAQRSEGGTAKVEVRHVASGTVQEVSIGIIYYGSIPTFTSDALNEKGEIDIIEGESSAFGWSLKYKGTERNLKDAKITYTLDTNDYITINETTGEITTKSVGVTNVTVSVEWRGYTETKTIKVSVCEDLTLSIAGEGIVEEADGTQNVSLYTFAATVNGVSYKNSLQLTCDDGDAEGEVKEWVSTNTEVATVDANGLVTIVGLGEAQIYFIYETDMAEYTSKLLNVSVTMPTIQDESKTLLVDLYEAENLADYSIDTAKLFGEAVAIDRLVVEGMEMPMTDGKVDISAVAPGDYSVVFTSEAAGYSLQTSVVVATKVINTPEELLAGLHTYAENATQVTSGDGAGTFWDYDGYFVLGQDIDFTGAEVLSAPHGNSIQTELSNVYTVEHKGFRGTFNGMGHSIQNAGFWAGGMFGEVASGAVIKNTKFENAQVYYAWGAKAAILGVNMAAATIENCYFEVSCVNYPDSNNWTNASSVLAGFTYYGATIKDTVIVMKENHASLSIIGYEGGTWNGIQGPFFADNVLVLYMTDEGSTLAYRDGLMAIRVNDFVNRKTINIVENQVVSIAANSGVTCVVKTDDESVLSINGFEVSGLKVGTAKIWLEFTMGDYEVVTQGIEITVVEEAAKDYIEITSEKELRAISGVESDKPYKLMNNITIAESGTVITELLSTLDLNGFTIERISTNPADKFFISKIGSTGVLMNGKINFFFGPTGATGHQGVIVHENNGLVENMEIDAQLNSYSDWNNLIALFSGGTGTYKNMVVKVMNHTGNANYAGIFRDAIETLSLENCIFISQNVPLTAFREDWDIMAKDFSDFASVTNCVLVSSIEEYTAQNYNTENFSNAYWTIDETTGLPSIKA